jgi:hypothetical protein
MSSYPPSGPHDPSAPYGPGDQHGPPNPSVPPGQYAPGPYPSGQYGAPTYGQYPNPYPGPDVTADPLVPRSLSEWVSKVVGVVSRSWQPLVLIQLAAALPGLLIGSMVSVAVGDPASPVAPSPAVSVGLLGGLVVTLVVAVVFALFAQGASIFVAVRDAVGRPARAGEALSFAAGRALPLFGWGLLAALLVAVGFLLLFVPGLYFVVVFGAALAGVVVIEQQGIGRAFALVNRRFWPTAGRLLLAFVAAGIYNAIATFVADAFSTPGSLVHGLLSGVLALPVTLASVGVAVVTYAELRHHENPAVTSPVLAAQMEA